MDALSWNLVAAALGVAVIHTALGPDHYLPFLMLGRARGWSLTRALQVTALCGAGHVASSLLLGGLGLLAGRAVLELSGLEAWRGDVAAWALVLFGTAYALWGVRRAVRDRAGLEPHAHGAEHGDAGRKHVHIHRHGGSPHRHAGPERSGTTFWALFLVFVLGPCEPLIPLFLIPASRGRWDLALLTGLVFGVATILTMLVLVGFAHAGLRRLPLGPLERWSHALAGGTITACGLAVLFLGL